MQLVDEDDQLYFFPSCICGMCALDLTVGNPRGVQLQQKLFEILDGSVDGVALKCFSFFQIHVLIHDAVDDDPTAAELGMGELPVKLPVCLFQSGSTHRVTQD